MSVLLLLRYTSYTYLSLKLLEDEISTVQRGEPIGVQHKRVACGKEDLLRERLCIPSTEEHVGELDKAVLP